MLLEAEAVSIHFNAEPLRMTPSNRGLPTDKKRGVFSKMKKKTLFVKLNEKILSLTFEPGGGGE